MTDTDQQIFAEVDAFIDSLSPEDLARKMMGYGMRFKNPPATVEIPQEVIAVANAEEFWSKNLKAAWQFTWEVKLKASLEDLQFVDADWRNLVNHLPLKAHFLHGALAHCYSMKVKGGATGVANSNELALAA